MKKQRELLRRQGSFWSEGMPLTEADRQLLQPLIDRAEELGYTPIVSEVPTAGKIKGRFRCWKDALKAAGLPSEKEPGQVAKRLAAKEQREQERCKQEITDGTHSLI